MPKDKSATNAKIIACMREEFLTYGYEKASLNRISAKVGITTAGLYKHFSGKEDMFGFLVKDALDALDSMQSKSISEMSAKDYDPFSDEISAELIELIYQHFESWKLLVCCSGGSKYESFEEELIDIETASNKHYAEILRRAGKSVKPLTEMEWHILSTEYIHLVLEIVRHDMAKDEAYRHMSFVKTLLYPGWKEIFGL
ncbi:MAG: TetR/AcrR family transcriptional regulator [Ruminococcus sp.]|nr:TetR/AcrR family transcriptional regulator [Ruminococcus sp.]